MKWLLTVFVLFLNIFLSITANNNINQNDNNQQQHNQWSTLLSAHDYSQTMKWKLTRNRAIDLQWSTQDHTKSINSISISNSTEYIVSCSSDGYAKFHRVLMYPNLYPDWTHLYYGDLKLRENALNLQCIMTPDQSQLITLSISNTSNTEQQQQLYLDIYNFEELDKSLYNIDNRLPIFNNNKHPRNINDLSKETNFRIIFPQDDYNEIWWNTTSKNIDKYQFKSNSISLDSNNSNNNNRILISPNGKILIVVLSRHKLLIQSQSKIDDPINLNSLDIEYEILDIVFLPQYDEDHISQFMIVPKYSSMNTTKDKPKVILYTLNSAISDQWEKTIINTPSVFPFIRLSTSIGKKCQSDNNNNNNNNDNYYKIISFLDTENTVHLTSLNSKSNRLKILKSFPKPPPIVDVARSATYNRLNRDHSNVIMRFSPDSLYFAIQYPGENEILIYYQRNTNYFTLHSLIDLESHYTKEFQFFNLKHYYLVVETSGHLNYFRESLPKVNPQCDGLARQHSFYLPPPPLPLSQQQQQISTNTHSEVEHYGIFYEKTTLILLAVISVLHLYFIMDIVKTLESLIISRLLSKLPSITNLIFWIAISVIFGLSIFEVLYQPAFTNDWPAHIHHIDQFLNNPKSEPLWTPDYSSANSSSHFDFDYSHFMHYHGPCTYPAGFIYLYTALYYITYGGSLQIFQIIWAIMEVFNFITIKKICEKLKLPLLLAILPVLSNRLHLYNVRVVINDFPSTFLLHISILFLLNRQYKRFSVLFSFLVSLKLNYIFYSPAILFIFFKSLSFHSVLTNLFIMGIIQIIIGLPFLITNPIAYLTIAYDINRTLLWEKTRNFKFVGREIYDSTIFKLLLIFLLFSTIIVLMIRMSLKLKSFQSLIDNLYSKTKISNNGAEIENAKTMTYSTKTNIPSNTSQSPNHRKKMLLLQNRIFIFVFLFVNFLAITFARGLYTPFLCWYFYTYPIVLFISGYPYSYIISFWIAHEYLFRFFKDQLFEMNATYLFFLINIFTVFHVLVVGRFNLTYTPTPSPPPPPKIVNSKIDNDKKNN